MSPLSLPLISWPLTDFLLQEGRELPTTRHSQTHCLLCVQPEFLGGGAGGASEAKPACLQKTELPGGSRSTFWGRGRGVNDT